MRRGARTSLGDALTEQPVSLALQGGGAHGAYTWGVLDALLEYTKFKPVALSGASAGAMNASALATGYLRGGREGARAHLGEFWEAVGKAGDAQNAAADAWKAMLGHVGANVVSAWAEMLSNLTGPYAGNPLNINPLRELVDDGINCAELRRQDDLALFIAATSVTTGGLKIFTHKDINTDVLLASACLPNLFQAVEIKGEAYWDGGYAGNPPLWPLIDPCPAPDLIIVHINPLVRDDVPRQTESIALRVDEISFNAPLLGELRAINRFRPLAMKQKPMKQMFFKSARPPRLHAIHADAALGDLGPQSKLKTDWDFLQELHARGRENAKTWINNHGDDVGRCNSLDLPELMKKVDRIA